jgi:hypothetical protein
MVYGLRPRMPIDRSPMSLRRATPSTILPVLLLMMLSAWVSPLGAQEVPAATDTLPPVTVRVVAAENLTGPVSSYQRVVRDAMEVILERRGFLREAVDSAEAVPADETVVLEYRYHLVGFLPRLHLAVAVWDAD